MKLGGARGSEELIPGFGTKAGDAGQAALDITKIDSADQTGEIGAKGAQTRVGVFVPADAQHQKDGVPGERTDDRLGNNNLIHLARCLHHSISTGNRLLLRIAF
jgi:hypothetical protein